MSDMLSELNNGGGLNLTVTEIENQRIDDIIKFMSSTTGVKYSDEQVNILRQKGGMCILASAGSGKTTVLNHLIAKRVMSGEIPDPNKLLCTTFSRGGATEMGQRLDNLLKQLGIRARVQVKTLHAVYLQLLKDLGYNLEIIENSTKLRYIREACKENEVQLEDDEFQTLEGIFGYQINNLMSDSDLFKSYAYTLREKIPLAKYSNIRQTFSNKKQQEGCMDFDDMQLFVYTLLKSPQYGAAIQQYCHSLWEHIYVDEAQDVSKIQFEILKVLVSDPNKFVFIGDDDQCLVEGTMVSVPGGAYAIEDIKTGDLVLSALGNGYTGYCTVTSTSKKPYKGKIIKVVTESGCEIKATPEHVVFARRYETDLWQYTGNGMMYQMFAGEPVDKEFVSKWKAPRFKSIGKGIGDCKLHKMASTADLDTIESKVHELEKSGIGVIKQAKLTDKMYDLIQVGSLQIGMELVHTMPCNALMTDKIVAIEVENYNGYVYDISVPETRNFIANRLVVHNCIYQWRGADPSIILDVCGVYTDLTLMKLTTNYRCKGTIVEKADHGIKFNRTRSNKTMRPFQSGGEIRVCDVGNGNMFEMSKYAYKYIKELIIDKGVNPNDIAVLSRNNQHLTILNNMLFKDGIYCKSSDDMKFTRCGTYRILEGIIQMGNNTTNGNVTANNLWKCCMFMKMAYSKEIGKLQSAYGVSLRDILGFLLTEYAGYKDLGWKNPGMKVSKLDYAKYSDFMARMQTATVENMISIYKLLANEPADKATVGLLCMFISTKVDLFFKAEETARFAEGYIEYMCELINNMGMAGFNRYIKTTSQYESGGMAVISPMVTLSTMHGAKGREWKYVVIFADDNVSFPSFQNIQNNIADGVPDSDIRNMIDENRRLHYVAMTRAKEHLTIFAFKKNLSVYTLEALGIMDFGKDNDSNIIAMSQHGLYKDLIHRAEDEIFNNESPYYMAMDVSKLETKVEVAYLFEKQQAEKDSNFNSSGTAGKTVDTSFNLNNIQTYAPMTLGDE